MSDMIPIKPPAISREQAAGGSPNLQYKFKKPIDTQAFSRVLSQVKLLEQGGTTDLIKTLRKQAKTLKMSRKKILQSSASMSDY